MTKAKPKYKLGDYAAEKFALLIYKDDYDKAVAIAEEHMLSTSAFVRLAIKEKLARYEARKNPAI